MAKMSKCSPVGQISNYCVDKIIFYDYEILTETKEPILGDETTIADDTDAGHA